MLSRKQQQAFVVGPNSETVFTVARITSNEVELAVQASDCWELPGRIILGRNEPLECGPGGQKAVKIMFTAVFSISGADTARIGVETPPDWPAENRLEVLQARLARDPGISQPDQKKR